MTSQFSIKYRPRKWDDVYGHESIVKALKKRSVEDNFPKATLFVGPYGTGKTTLAEILAACIQSHDEEGNPNWNHPSCKSILNGTFDRDTQRLDGSQLSGKTDMVDFTRGLNMKPLYDKKKILIIEEADMLSGAAFNSLLKVLEDNSAHVHFILLSMDERKGVPPAIRSRCQVYNVKALGIKDIMMGLKHIMDLETLWEDENIPREFRFEGLKTIATSAKGSMRTAVQNLEKCLINEAYLATDIENLIDEVGELATWRILDGLLDKSKDDSLWRSIMKYKGDEIIHLYQYMIMLLSEAVLYKETGFVYDDNAEVRLRTMGNNPNAEALLYTLTLHPQLNKPFIRNSDLIGALVGYYQGIDMRPNTLRKEEPTIKIGVDKTIEDIFPDTSKVQVRQRIIKKG